MKYKLSDICHYRKGKVDVSLLTDDTYISTENMMPNRGGITKATTLPTVDSTQLYKKGDVLVSNIRPYFKKIWQATCDGGCSNDVLVFQANEGFDQDYLYYVLSDDAFFAYAMKTSKGTKMPRGDKHSIMQYETEVCDLDTQRKIASLLKSIDGKIELNNAINNNLMQQARLLFKSWFVDYLPFGCIVPTDWQTMTLGEVSNMSAGGDKPKVVTQYRDETCKYPIYSNGLSDDGLYGYTNEPKIFDESVTVSARGTIGFVCLRHIPYVPIVRLVTLVPKANVMDAKYLYLYLNQLHIRGTGTTQQQLTVPDFRKTTILVPTKSVLDHFSDIVTPLFTKKWANDEENSSLADLRNTLLPKLLSGELDVSDIDL